MKNMELNVPYGNASDCKAENHPKTDIPKFSKCGLSIEGESSLATKANEPTRTEIIQMNPKELIELIYSKKEILHEYVERGDLVVVMILCCAKIDVNHKKGNKLPIDIAWDKRHLDIVLELIDNNSKFPKNFDYSKASTELRKRSEDFNMIHEKTKEGDYMAALQIAKEYPKLTYFFNTSNVPIKQIQNFDLWKELIQNHKRDPIIKLIRDNFESYGGSDVQVRVDDFKEKIFQYLSNLKENRIILEIVTSKGKPNIVIDYMTDNDTEKVDSASGKIVIAAKKYLIANNATGLAEKIYDALYKYAMGIIFQNNGKPYECNKEEEYDQFIANEIERLKRTSGSKNEEKIAEKAKRLYFFTKCFPVLYKFLKKGEQNKQTDMDAQSQESETGFQQKDSVKKQNSRGFPEQDNLFEFSQIDEKEIQMAETCDQNVQSVKDEQSQESETGTRMSDITFKTRTFPDMSEVENENLNSRESLNVETCNQKIKTDRDESSQESETGYPQVDNVRSRNARESIQTDETEIQIETCGQKEEIDTDEQKQESETGTRITYWTPSPQNHPEMSDVCNLNPENLQEHACLLGSLQTDTKIDIIEERENTETNKFQQKFRFKNVCNGLCRTSKGILIGLLIGVIGTAGIIYLVSGNEKSTDLPPNSVYTISVPDSFEVTQTLRANAVKEYFDKNPPEFLDRLAIMVYKGVSIEDINKYRDLLRNTTDGVRFTNPDHVKNIIAEYLAETLDYFNPKTMDSKARIQVQSQIMVLPKHKKVREIFILRVKKQKTSTSKDYIGIIDKISKVTSTVKRNELSSVLNFMAFSLYYNQNYHTNFYDCSEEFIFTDDAINLFVKYKDCILQTFGEEDFDAFIKIQDCSGKSIETALKTSGETLESDFFARHNIQDNVEEDYCKKS